MAHVLDCWLPIMSTCPEYFCFKSAAAQGRFLLQPQLDASGGASCFVALLRLTASDLHLILEFNPPEPQWAQLEGGGGLLRAGARRKRTNIHKYVVVDKCAN